MKGLFSIVNTTKNSKPTFALFLQYKYSYFFNNKTWVFIICMLTHRPYATKFPLNFASWILQYISLLVKPLSCVIWLCQVFFWMFQCRIDLFIFFYSFYVFCALWTFSLIWKKHRFVICNRRPLNMDLQSINLSDVQSFYGNIYLYKKAGCLQVSLRYIA